MFTRTHSFTTIAATVALLSAAALTGCSAGATTAGGNDSPGSSPAAVTPDAPPAVPGLNTPVSAGTFEYTALAVKDAGTTVGSSILSQTAQGTFFQVDLNVANTGNEPQTFLVNYVKLVDADGKTYNADSSATIYASSDAQTWIASLNPGNSVQGPILFDLPAGVKPTQLLVSDSAFSDGTPIQIG